MISKSNNGLIFSLAMMFLAEGTALEAQEATLLYHDGKRENVVISNVSETHLQMHAGGSVSNLPLVHLKFVSIREPGEDMLAAKRHFTKKEYGKAEAAFKEMASKHDHLGFLGKRGHQNFASISRFYQLECLWRMGNYADIGAALESVTGTNLGPVLTESQKHQYALFPLWEKADKGGVELSQALKAYENGLDKSEAENRTAAILAQVAFLKAQHLKELNKSDEALHYYYKAMTLNNGMDEYIVQQSLLAVTGLVLTDPNLNNDPRVQTDLYAIAVMLDSMGRIPERLEPYLKHPRQIAPFPAFPAKATPDSKKKKKSKGKS